MVNGLDLLIVAVVSVGLGFTTATLWLEWDTDTTYDEAYRDGYDAALHDARSDADGQAHRYEPPF